MRSLYTGLTPPNSKVTHCPFIRIAPRPVHDPDVIQMFRIIREVTHLVFTSKTTVRVFFDYLPQDCDISSITIFAVGSVTKSHLESQGVNDILTPQEQTAEGLIDLIHATELKSPKFLWPHSARWRRVCSDYFQQQQIPYSECGLYDIVAVKPDPLPNLDDFDEIIFSSPSTVEGFLEAYKTLPSDKRLTPIGSITANVLNAKKK